MRTQVPVSLPVTEWVVRAGRSASQVLKGPSRSYTYSHPCSHQPRLACDSSSQLPASVAATQLLTTSASEASVRMAWLLMWVGLAAKPLQAQPQPPASSQHRHMPCMMERVHLYMQHIPVPV